MSVGHVSRRPLHGQSAAIMASASSACKSLGKSRIFAAWFCRDPAHGSSSGWRMRERQHEPFLRATGPLAGDTHSCTNEKILLDDALRKSAKSFRYAPRRQKDLAR